MLEHPLITHVNRYGLPTLSDADQDWMEQVDDLRETVSDWAENELNEGREPTWEGFVSAFPEHDREDYIDIIEQEIKAATERADHSLKHEIALEAIA